ncbi:hypothetical protein BG011_009663 [Mortierella polycephala]|uniref:Uncharacterized protein n=1 Tax=Mortierella polycephala TaxID=41804 RepID=A0A9P6PMQ0_9FUNG|nr:hypothetical protein BG011_009663 [Mortierella polycephala]
MATLVNFISQRIHLPLSPSVKYCDGGDYFTAGAAQGKQQQPKSVFSQLAVKGDQRQRAVQQFPCEERHSFNPHYQHNLWSASPALSTPPSLCPSSSNSSPSSIYTSSCHSSLSRATGSRFLAHEPQYTSSSSSYSSARGFPTTSTMTTSSSSSNNKQSYSSYHRAKRNARLQQLQQRDHHEWMFGISDDDDLHIDNESGSWTACASPVDSPISPVSSSSAGSSLMRHSSTRSQPGHVADVFQSEPQQPKKKRSMVTFSPVILHHPTPSGEQHSIPSAANVLPSISESSLSTLARSSTAATITTLATTAIVNQQQPKSDAGRLTAKESLMRIAQCGKSQDGWCPQSAGQYTQRYAETRPRAMMLDGRRRGRH